MKIEINSAVVAAEKLKEAGVDRLVIIATPLISNDNNLAYVNVSFEKFSKLSHILKDICTFKSEDEI